MNAESLLNKRKNSAKTSGSFALGAEQTFSLTAIRDHLILFETFSSPLLINDIHILNIATIGQDVGRAKILDNFSFHFVIGNVQMRCK